MKLRVLRTMCSCWIVAAITIFGLSGCGEENNDNEMQTSISKDNSETDEKSIESKGEKDMDISKKVKLNLSNHQIFNDTNNDGYGEFEGFGTSLCWWANRLGYSTELTEQAAEAFYNADTGLGMNIGRYNIGGGDNVTTMDVTITMQEKNPFLHKEHIRRSDSVVPGYATDVTKIDLDNNSKEYYEENFARADFDCGFAWNYDWKADKNQMNILKAAADKAGDEFIGEAFSNSPPYFMTVSGCSSGNVDGSEDNLRENSYRAFACYMADVIEHWSKEGVINFQSVDPMNEPATSYWSAFSEKQEGCHFSQGESQSKILIELNNELKNKGIDIIICGTDETSIDTANVSFNLLSDEAKEILDRIDTHSYMGTLRETLRKTAEENGKNLWMSEVDGTYTMSKKTGAMYAALGFADAIRQDLNGMFPTAWIMWDAVDVHVDSHNQYDMCTRVQADKIIADGDPFWGIAIADHDTKELLLSKKYYAFGQFSKFIRPGFCLVESGENTVAAYNPEESCAVVVTINTSVDDQMWEFDISDLGIDISEISAIRTSGDIETGENWKDVSDSDDIRIDGQKFDALVKGASITTYIIK